MNELPALTRLPDALLAEHAHSHARFDISLDAVDPVVARLVTRMATRICVDAIANLRPTVRGVPAIPLFPTPRSFRSAHDLARVGGAAAAYRYVDSRLSIVRSGFEPPPAMLPEAPYVLNALTEGRMDNPMEMNPGMIRSIEYEGVLPLSDDAGAPRRACRALLDQAMSVANDTSEPAVARAGWLLTEIGKIHPFADGNGRVARLLYLLVTGSDMPKTADWGFCEQLRFFEEDWAIELKTRDPTASVIRATELSRDGARLFSRRLEVLSSTLPEIARYLDLSPEATTLTVAFWLHRVGRLDEIAADLGISYPEGMATSEGLCRSEVLIRWPSAETTGWRDPACVSGGRGARSVHPFYRTAPTIEAALHSLLNHPEGG